MTRNWWTALFAAAALAPTGALAQDETPTEMQGLALLTSCRASEPGCGAYLQGIVDMMIAQQSVCDPPRYNRHRLRTTYVRWAEANTYFHDKHMMAGAERAMSEAWPCRSNPPH